MSGSGRQPIVLVPTTKVYPPLKVFVGYSLMKAGARVRALIEEVLQDLDICPGHFGVLTVLANEGPLLQFEMCEILGIDRATMVKIVDQLETLGAVTRQVSGSDRRARVIKLCPYGKKLQRESWNRIEKANQKFLSAIPAVRQKLFHDLVNELLESKSTHDKAKTKPEKARQ